MVSAFVRDLPKAELHLHIEGTLEPDLLFKLAERNAVKLEYASVEEVAAAYQFTDLQSFLDVYYQAAQTLVTEQDFFDLTLAYLVKVSGQGVRRAEIFFDPQTHTDRGVPFEAVLEGTSRALAVGHERFGISSGLILCFLRHLGPGPAMETLERALPYRNMLLGVGLDSSEVGFPPEDFSAVFDLARSEGLRLVAHAGEEGPPEYVWAALDVLGVERIDHGNRALEDDKLIERLVNDRVPLTVCPLSNVKLNVVDRLEDHPLPRMLDLGLNVSLNSDDPSYFGGYVGDNYLAVQQALGLDDSVVVEIARNSLRASFLSETDKTLLEAELDEYVGGRD